jgi:hypothetical protein
LRLRLQGSHGSWLAAPAESAYCGWYGVAPLSEERYELLECANELRLASFVPAVKALRKGAR